MTDLRGRVIGSIDNYSVRNQIRKPYYGVYGMSERAE